MLQGAIAAGMRVVVVPSLVESHDEFKAISQEEAAADGKGGEQDLFCCCCWWWFSALEGACMSSWCHAVLITWPDFAPHLGLWPIVLPWRGKQSK
jgi:hypothetical protein